MTLERKTLLSNYFSEDVERTSVITQMNPEDACAAINETVTISHRTNFGNSQATLSASAAAAVTTN